MKRAYILSVLAISSIFFACSSYNHLAVKQISQSYEKSENFRVTDTLVYSLNNASTFFETLPLFYFYEFGLKDSNILRNLIESSLVDTIFLKNDTFFYLNNGRETNLASTNGESPIDSLYLEYPYEEYNSYLLLQEVSSDSLFKFHYKVVNIKYSDPIWNQQEGFFCRDVWYGIDWKINEVHICHENGPIFKLRRIIK